MKLSYERNILRLKNSGIVWATIWQLDEGNYDQNEKNAKATVVI